MLLKTVIPDKVVLDFLGKDIPTIGPSFNSRDNAVLTARRYVETINKLSAEKPNVPFQLVLSKQADGRYSLVVDCAQQIVGTLENLDELLVRRFRKSLKKKLFVLTCFVEDADGLECLVVTEGLGAVFYSPNTMIT